MVLVALVRRDATLARRGPSRATGRPPLGAPPWRCRPGTASIAGTACRLRREGSTQPGISAGRGTGLSCPRLRAAVDATSRSAIRIVSGGRPSMSEDESVCSIAAFRSQLLFEFRGGVVHIDADRTWVFSSKRPRQAAPVADPFRPRCPQRDDYVLESRRGACRGFRVRVRIYRFHHATLSLVPGFRFAQSGLQRLRLRSARAGQSLGVARYRGISWRARHRLQRACTLTRISLRLIRLQPLFQACPRCGSSRAISQCGRV